MFGSRIGSSYELDDAEPRWGVEAARVGGRPRRELVVAVIVRVVITVKVSAPDFPRRRGRGVEEGLLEERPRDVPVAMSFASLLQRVACNI